jgi:hypothetical protein
LKPVKQQRHAYAHPHGPRVRLNLEAPALSAAKHAELGPGVVAPCPAPAKEMTEQEKQVSKLLIFISVLR